MSNYRKGANFEREIKKRFERQGWYVIRSAGSKGLVDLILVKNGKVILVNCKLNQISKKEDFNFSNLVNRLKVSGIICTKKLWLARGCEKC